MTFAVQEGEKPSLLVSSSLVERPTIKAGRSVRFRGDQSPKIRSCLMENYSARRDRLLVEEVTVDRGQETSPGGIYMPDTAQQFRDSLKRVVVVSVGPGVYNLQGTLNPVNIQEGQTLLIGPHAGTELRLNGVKYLSIVESDVHGVVTAA